MRNSGSSKTGVDFRWHTHKEYAKLSKEQKNELREWQNSNEGKAQIDKYHEEKRKRNNDNGKSGKNNNMTRKQLQAKINSLEAKGSKDDDITDEVSAYVSAAFADLEESETKKQKEKEKQVKFSTIMNDRNQAFKVASQVVQKIIKRQKGEWLVGSQGCNDDVHGHCTVNDYLRKKLITSQFHHYII